MASPDPTSPTYTVRDGDSLGLIVARFGATIRSFIDANADRFPTLRTQPTRIEPGWTLSIPEGAVRSNDGILYVGMNPGSQIESKALRATRAKVTAIHDAAEPDQVKGSDGQVYDLSSKEGAIAFAETFGLSPEQTERVAVSIFNGWDDARDEIGSIAQVWAAAERGETIPSRLVLSGHSVGQGVWGDENGTLTLDALADLALAMPKAARSVEDLHISGCYSGGAYAMERLRAVFPRVKTIWAYTTSAPSGALAAQHEQLWERATRGSRDDLDRAIAARLAAGDHVAVWSVKHGYQNGRPPAPLAEVRDEYELLEPTFDDYLQGRQEVWSPHHGPLRDYYNVLQTLLQHPDLPAEERPALDARRDVTIRLIYFKATVERAFASRYADEIRAGYTAVDLPPPDFSKLSRANALAQINALAERVNREDCPPEDAASLLPLLENGLEELSPSLIPDAWV
jgi:hypothetical protein